MRRVLIPLYYLRRFFFAMLRAPRAPDASQSVSAQKCAIDAFAMPILPLPRVTRAAVVAATLFAARR